MKSIISFSEGKWDNLLLLNASRSYSWWAQLKSKSFTDKHAKFYLPPLPCYYCKTAQKNYAVLANSLTTSKSNIDYTVFGFFPPVPNAYTLRRQNYHFLMKRPGKAMWQLLSGSATKQFKQAIMNITSNQKCWLTLKQQNVFTQTGIYLEKTSISALPENTLNSQGKSVSFGCKNILRSVSRTLQMTSC